MKGVKALGGDFLGGEGEGFSLTISGMAPPMIGRATVLVSRLGRMPISLPTRTPYSYLIRRSALLKMSINKDNI